MKDVNAKVAFITGGASGIGFAMAQAFLRAGMKVVIADISQANLDDAAGRLQQTAGEYVFLRLDVADRAAMAEAADYAQREFGKVHVLCNNAGLGAGAPISTATYADWDRLLAVNLHGVINGIVTFIPRMRAHGEGAHIVNTSSMAGIVPLPDPGGIYTTAKFAIVGMSQSLRLGLAAADIGVSVLCPGLTRTRIFDDMRDSARSGAADELSAGFVDAHRYAMDPGQVGDAVLEGIRRNDAYILPHAEFIDEVRALQAEIIAAFRTDIDIDPGRAAFENVRRRMTDDIKASIPKIR